MASPPRFLKLESETTTKKVAIAKRNQSLTGTMKLKATNLGFWTAIKEMKVEIQGSAPTFGSVMES